MKYIAICMVLIGFGFWIKSDPNKTESLNTKPKPSLSVKSQNKPESFSSIETPTFESIIKETETTQSLNLEEDTELTVLCEPVELSLCQCRESPCKQDQRLLLLAIYQSAFPNELPDDYEMDERFMKLVDWKRGNLEDNQSWRNAERYILSGYTCYVQDEEACYNSHLEEYANSQLDAEFQIAGDEWQPREEDNYNPEYVSPSEEE